mmetsp:Transcript_11025/g.25915  ORF Transcript_11025/g.25915 Transcript_11025/m.25915 type:complete len:329 (-) Transcript_11025:38-1024(-)
MLRASFRSAAALGLCLISKLPASSAASFYFVAANSMACYETTNSTALNLTLEAYAHSPWRVIYLGSVIKSGDCKSAGYLIPTTDPEVCSSNTSLTVYLDNDNIDNIRWAEAEYSVAKDFAEKQGLDVETVLRTLESICKKPALADARVSSSLLGARIPAASSGGSSHWELGRTALPDPRATIEQSVDSQLSGTSAREDDHLVKTLNNYADRAASIAATAQRNAEAKIKAAAAAWRTALESTEKPKRLEDTQPHVVVANNQSSTESEQASSGAGDMKDVAQKVDRLEKELRDLHDLLKSLGRGIEETSPLTVEAPPATSLRGSGRLPRE